MFRLRIFHDREVTLRRAERIEREQQAKLKRLQRAALEDMKRQGKKLPNLPHVKELEQNAEDIDEATLDR